MTDRVRTDAAVATLAGELRILPRGSTQETAIACLDLLAAIASPSDRLALQRARREVAGEVAPAGHPEIDDRAAIGRILASANRSAAIEREAKALAQHGTATVESIARRLRRKLKNPDATPSLCPPVP